MTVLRGDCIELMQTLDADSIDAVVTDPPYGIAFMKRAWDDFGELREYQSWCERWARELYRVMRAGAYLLAFGSPRTYHRIAAGIEDAGFRVRDQIMWIYANGLPKTRRLTGDWNGWGTGLKPSHEPLVLAQKPFLGAITSQVVNHGVGGLNIDGSRHAAGRYPANIVLTDPVFDGDADGVVGGGVARSAKTPAAAGWKGSGIFGPSGQGHIYGDSGTYSRFFLIPKAPKRERMSHNGTRSPHPTQKPEQLIRHLVTLITPPGGVVLDPFLGSGTLGVVCEQMGIRWMGIERETAYADWAEQRIAEGKTDWERSAK